MLVATTTVGFLVKSFKKCGGAGVVCVVAAPPSGGVRPLLEQTQMPRVS